MQVENSIQNQSVPWLFLPGPGWMHPTGQASTQSATPSQVLVTIVWATANPQQQQSCISVKDKLILAKAKPKYVGADQ
jgi:hypothetical protein